MLPNGATQHKLKFIKKFSIDDTPNDILEVYLAITSTISYLDNVLNLNYQKQFLLFSKDMLNEKNNLREHQYNIYVLNVIILSFIPNNFF